MNSPRPTSQRTTSQPQASPASPSPLPLIFERASETTAISGRRLLRYSLPPGPLGSAVKTLLVSYRWRSTIYVLIWKASATPAGRLFFRLAARARPISESVSSFWPTPVAMDASRGRYRTARQKGSRRGLTIATVMPWPTPTARDHKDSAGMARAKGARRRLDTLPRLLHGKTGTQSNAPTACSGRLEVGLASWLMGFPIELLRCARLEMPSFRRSLRKSAAR